jgi:hypothetical protein
MRPLRRSKLVPPLPRSRNNKVRSKRRLLGSNNQVSSDSKRHLLDKKQCNVSAVVVYFHILLSSRLEVLRDWFRLLGLDRHLC